jgi:hypothetical protein
MVLWPKKNQNNRIPGFAYLKKPSTTDGFHETIGDFHEITDKELVVPSHNFLLRTVIMLKRISLFNF